LVAPLYDASPYRPAYPVLVEPAWWCAPYQRYYPDVDACPEAWQAVAR
jgi:hypothetical protein